MLRLINLSAGGKVTKCQTYFGVKKLFTYFAVLGMLAICNLITAHAAERCPNTAPKIAEVNTNEPFGVISLSSKSVKLFIGKTIVEPFGSTVETLKIESFTNPLGVKIFTNALISKQDYAACLYSIAQLKSIALKTVDENRLYIVLSSTVSNWEGGKDLALKIEEAGLSKKVVSVSDVEEAKYSIFGISTDHRQLNESLLIDAGSGSTKFVTAFIQKNKPSEIRVVTLDGITAIAHRAKTQASFIEGLKKEASAFSKEVNENLEAIPSFGRGTVILSGGIAYAISLHSGAPLNTRFYKIEQKAILEFIRDTKNCKSVAELFPDTNIAQIFSRDQLITGATVIECLQQCVLDQKSVFLAYNAPAWELILGQLLSTSQSAK